jgi:phosphoglycerate-specific signal transduction histidine kinase
MNRTEIAGHLANSEREISEHTAIVERQRALVQELHRTDADKTEIDNAFSHMIVLEERLSLLEHDRDWFRKALELPLNE